jgi:hypothetical protein
MSWPSPSFYRDQFLFGARFIGHPTELSHTDAPATRLA